MSSLYYLIEENFQKIDSFWISKNPSAMDFLERHPEKINWNALLLLFHVKSSKFFIKFYFK